MCWHALMWMIALVKTPSINHSINHSPKRYSFVYCLTAGSDSISISPISIGPIGKSTLC